MNDKHTYGKKMARKGRTKVICKGTFISKQSLLSKHKNHDWAIFVAFSDKPNFRKHYKRIETKNVSCNSAPIIDLI